MVNSRYTTERGRERKNEPGNGETGVGLLSRVDSEEVMKRPEGQVDNKAYIEITLTFRMLSHTQKKKIGFY